MFDLSLSSLLEEAFRAADDVADRHGSGFGLVQLVDVIKLAANLKAVSAEEYAESAARIDAKILEVRKKMPGDVTASSCVDSLVGLKRVLKQLATGQAIPRDLE